MQLRDSVTILQTANPDTAIESVPAFVWYQKTAAAFQESVGFTLSSELKVMAKPHQRLTRGVFLLWQGRILYSRAQPEISMRHGKPHHYTLTVEEVSEGFLP